MRIFGKLAAVALPAVALAACGGTSRDQIKVVGSSTVYPFTTAVAEQFVNKRTNMKAPVVESTGTGAGIKLFCAGTGPQHPDILNASRPLHKGEYEDCRSNGVTEIIELPIGADGIALAESNSGPKLQLTRKDVYLALAANPMGRPNAAKTWKDVNAALPAIPIQVYGPPSTSGTRDAFAELILNPGCEAAMPEAKSLKNDNPERYADACTKMRDDGVYVDKGENDNLIVQNLAANPNALGIFGYSYLEENKDRLRGVRIEGIEPTYETIAMATYPGARPLYLYVKKAHLKAVPGLKEFLEDYAEAWKPDGPLVKRGLIAGTRTQRMKTAETLANGIVLDPATLK